MTTLTIGCFGRSDIEDTDTAAGKYSHADFDQTKSLADSLYSYMQFRDAYKLYLQLLDSKEVETDNEKRLSVLYRLSNASELSGHLTEETKWLHLLLDLATQTGNNYYRSLAQISMGENVFYEGNHEKGIQYVSEAWLSVPIHTTTSRE